MKTKIIVILSCLLFLSGFWHLYQMSLIREARETIREFNISAELDVSYVNLINETLQQSNDINRLQADIVNRMLRGEHLKAESLDELEDISIEYKEKQELFDKQVEKLVDLREKRLEFHKNVKYLKSIMLEDL